MAERELHVFGVIDANGNNWTVPGEWVAPGWHRFSFTTSSPVRACFAVDETPIRVWFDGDELHARRLTRRERLIRWFRR